MTAAIWYKRVCQIITFTSALVVLLFAVSYFMWQSALIGSLPAVDYLAAGLALLTAFLGMFGFIFKHERKTLVRISFTAFFFYMITTAYVLATAGYLNYIFIVLWLLTAMISGVFGLIGLAGIVAGANAYLAAMVISGNVPSTNHFLIMLAATELPLIISFVFWNNRRNHGVMNGVSYDDLAEELSDTASKSDVVINAIADGVIALNNDGNIKLINPAAQKIIGWAKEDAMNLDFKSVIKLVDGKGEPVEGDANPVEFALARQETIVNDDMTMITSSGKKILVSLHISPVSGDKTGAIIVFRDITSEKKQEKEQAEFISTASHEMRTPVASIEGYLGLALNPNIAQIDDKAREYLMKAHDSARNLGQLFQDLLDISKAEDGRLTINPEVVDINKMITSLTSDFSAKAQQKGIYLNSPILGTASDVQGSKTLTPAYYSYTDEGHVREVISNLIENAIKYTKEGTVVVDVTGDDSTVTVTVTDSGIGIPPEDIPHLFQKFYRVDNTDTREIGGTGLGLYLCRRLAEAMDGHIWVTSELGKGSKFYLQLPRISREEAEQKASTTTIVPDAPAEKPVVISTETDKLSAAPSTGEQTAQVPKHTEGSGLKIPPRHL